MDFHRVRDYIHESKTIHVGGIITPDEIRKFTPIFGDIQRIAFRLSKMPFRPHETLNILDFDGTMSSRDRSLQEGQFMDNRGAAGIALAREKYGLYGFVNRYYQPGDVVSELVHILMSNNPETQSRILSTGLDKLQKIKFERTNILRLGNSSIVPEYEQKPEELLRHIMDDLGYIPGKKIIYEDTPDCYIETGPFLAKLLGSEIVVNHVKLSDSKFNTIDNIQQTIYKR